MCKKNLSPRRSRSVLLSKREKRHRKKLLEGKTLIPETSHQETKRTLQWGIKPGHGKEALF